MVESFSLKGVSGVVCFIVGMMLTIDFNTVDPRKFTDWKGYLFEIISVLARTVKPFILKYMLNSEMISNEVLACLSMLIAFLMMVVIFRPKFEFKKDISKKYIILCSLIAASMLTSGYAVVYAGAFMNSMLESFSVFAVIVLSFALYKKKFRPQIILGAILAVFGLCLVVL